VITSRQQQQDGLPIVSKSGASSSSAMERERGGDDHVSQRERGELRSEMVGGSNTSSKSGSSNIRREKDHYESRKDL
jgi:hypothetical protein